MDKFSKRANELLDRVKSLKDSFESREYSDGWGVDYNAPEEVTSQYPDLLLDVQILFFSDSPQLPLYVKSMALNEKIENRGFSNPFRYSDFAGLENLLSKYLQYRSFLEAKD